MSSTPEAWLRGPVAGVHPQLQPVAHALIQAGEEVAAALSAAGPDELWTRPGGAASVGFHALHLCGSLDRLLTYARGEGLSEAQRTALLAERDDGHRPSAESLAATVRDGVSSAIEQLRTTGPDSLDEPRAVGRAGLPSSVRGLLYHAGEHSARHAGQAVTTARIVRGLREG